MLTGADSIDDMNVLRHGGMGHLFDWTYAPSTLGSFLRSSDSDTSVSSMPSPPAPSRMSPLERRCCGFGTGNG